MIARFQGNQTKIRLACIDAPEIGQTPHGRIAMNTLRGLLPSHSRITIQPIKVDRYGRLVAHVFTPGGINIGEELIRLGLVFVYQMDSSYCDAPKLLLIEDQVRSQSPTLHVSLSGRYFRDLHLLNPNMNISMVDLELPIRLRPPLFVSSAVLTTRRHSNFVPLVCE